jgi:hypothetical protein
MYVEQRNIFPASAVIWVGFFLMYVGSRLSRDSVVGIATGCELDNRGVGV